MAAEAMAAQVAAAKRLAVQRASSEQAEIGEMWGRSRGDLGEI